MFTTGQRNTKMAGDSTQEDSDGKDTNPSWCIMRECGLEPVHFIWIRMAVRLYNA